MARMQSLIRLNVFTCLFYGVVTFHMIFILGLPRLISNMPWEELNWWKPAGLIECIPIFLASMFCQTQLHVTSTKCFQPTSSNMRFIVRVALVTVAIVYGFFGFFGYVAFINSQRTTLFSGNIFLMYPDDLRSYCIRIGFLLTNIVSIPLIIWPLRQTVYNLCCQKRFTSFGVDLEMNSSPMFTDEIPRRFMQKITIALLLISFLLSLTTDKIEVIIRYTTSIAGSLTGFILPALVLLVATTNTSAASSTSTTLTATSNNSSNHHDHDHPHHHKYSITSGSNSGRSSVLPRFLQFNRTQSIGAYCLLFVGCLLFSLEFFSVHPIDINNNNHELNTLPIQSKFYPTHTTTTTTTNYNHHHSISSINSPNDQSVQMRMMIASNSKILQPTTNHMKHPPSSSASSSSISMDQSKLSRETIDSASAQNHQFTMSTILNETRVKKEH
ncbi:unnamed protein product [Schistosoma turkestanicum]|nr:unnamed protein product [Schistosoma turkestanicum]